MTEKAAVELPAPVGGRVLSTTGAPGDMVPVGAELIVLETELGAAAQAMRVPALSGAPGIASAGGTAAAAVAGPPAPPAARTERVASAPAIRRRAHEDGIDLRQIAGSGPN